MMNGLGFRGGRGLGFRVLRRLQWLDLGFNAHCPPMVPASYGDPETQNPSMPRRQKCSRLCGPGLGDS